MTFELEDVFAIEFLFEQTLRYCNVHVCMYVYIYIYIYI